VRGRILSAPLPDMVARRSLIRRPLRLLLVTSWLPFGSSLGASDPLSASEFLLLLELLLLLLDLLLLRRGERRALDEIDKEREPEEDDDKADEEDLDERRFDDDDDDEAEEEEEEAFVPLPDVERGDTAPEEDVAAFERGLFFLGLPFLAPLS